MGTWWFILYIYVCVYIYIYHRYSVICCHFSSSLQIPQEPHAGGWSSKVQPSMRKHKSQINNIIDILHKFHAKQDYQRVHSMLFRLEMIQFKPRRPFFLVHCHPCKPNNNTPPKSHQITINGCYKPIHMDPYGWCMTPGPRHPQAPPLHEQLLPLARPQAAATGAMPGSENTQGVLGVAVGCPKLHWVHHLNR